MPELPEVEAVCRLIRPEVQGRTIVTASVLRPRTVAPLSPAEFSRKIRGFTVSSVTRRGKNLIFQLTRSHPPENSAVMLIHLRMSGNVIVLDNSGGKKSESPPRIYFADCLTKPESASGICVIFELDKSIRMVLKDRRGLAACSLLSQEEAAQRLSKIGVEPLSPEFTPQTLFALTRKSPQPIKVWLLSQRHIAGLGNIYAVEALFRAGIHPQAAAGSISRTRIGRLHGAIVSVLKDAVKSAIQGYRHPGDFSAQEEFTPQVYGREGQACTHCRSTVRRLRMQSRSTYFCPHCQRR